MNWREEVCFLLGGKEVEKEEGEGERKKKWKEEEGWRMMTRKTKSEIRKRGV